MNLFIKLMKKIILNYEMKHIEDCEPIFICSNIDTRNRAKNEKYKIPSDKPQCPIYEDNRCCGGCKLSSTCEHCVNCNCFGFAYGQMGGNDEGYYLHKSSEYYGLGRINKNGEFDWEYYYDSCKRRNIQPNKFIRIKDRKYKIKSKVDKNGNFKVISCDSNKLRTYNIKELDNYIHTYDDENNKWL